MLGAEAEVSNLPEEIEGCCSIRRIVFRSFDKRIRLDEPPPSVAEFIDRRAHDKATPKTLHLLHIGFGVIPLALNGIERSPKLPVNHPRGSRLVRAGSARDHQIALSVKLIFSVGQSHLNGNVSTTEARNRFFGNGVKGGFKGSHTCSNLLMHRSEN